MLSQIINKSGIKLVLAVKLSLKLRELVDRQHSKLKINDHSDAQKKHKKYDLKRILRLQNEAECDQRGGCHHG